MISKKIYIVLSFLACGSGIRAQQKADTQYLYWMRYQNQLSFSPTLSWVNEIDNRRFFNPDVANQLIMHSHVHYRNGKWDYAGGLTLSWAFAAVPEKGYTYAATEIRPFVEVNYEQPIGKVLLQNRLRIDNRFIQVQENESVWTESIYITRFRYRLQFRIPLKVNTEKISTISLKVADEIMLNGQENIFDQNRIYLLGEFLVSKNISIEAGYIYIYQQRIGKDEFFSRNVLRLSLFHRIKAFKSVQQN